MSRGMVVRAVLLGAAAGLLAWAFGVQGVRPAVIALCVAAGVAATLGIPAGWYGTWPDRPHAPSGGGSAQVWRLANRLRRYENDYDPALQHRLRSLAATRLRRLGAEWDDPRAVRALGADVHAALSEGTLRPSLRDADAVVTAIERLDQHRTLDQPGEGARP
ncbi:hypothetical protein [Jiangella mangrovi]|uniref:Uncharacterized protein n=1 Tax=Jiangella mangrovi TaxID=1524084 RepID=A0A7W9LQ14_9ACTN|nr:hypothetical protein [Jiangella mangrovi]MBB5791998.1 hypothetical protein [Jiangella mangrovi]